MNNVNQIIVAVVILLTATSVPADTENYWNSHLHFFDIIDIWGETKLLEIDEVVPLYDESGNRSVLFQQSYPIVSYTRENERETQHEPSMGVLPTWMASGNSEMDWMNDWALARIYPDYLGFDPYDSTSTCRLGAYFFPCQYGVWTDSWNHLIEYLASGVEFYYRYYLSPGKDWFSTEPGMAKHWGNLGESSNPFNYTDFGIDVMRDTRCCKKAVLEIKIPLENYADRESSRSTESGQNDLPAYEENPSSKESKIKTLTQLPDDPELLYEIFSEAGNSNADTVWLYSQYGPSNELIAFEDTPLRHFEKHEDKLLVNVHQVQTLNPELFFDSRLDSIEKIQAEMDLSVEILDRVVHHFKAQGKKVVVFGDSFGSAILHRYLVLKGTAAADRYVIMAGRLDMDQVVYENQLSMLDDSIPAPRCFYYFQNGSEPMRGRSDSYHSTCGISAYKQLQLVYEGTLLRHRYTQLLADMDLSKVVYVYATEDESVGQLTSSEIYFLETRNANVINIDGGQSALFNNRQAAKRISDALEEQPRVRHERVLKLQLECSNAIPLGSSPLEYFSSGLGLISCKAGFFPFERATIPMISENFFVIVRHPIANLDMTTDFLAGFPVEIHTWHDFVPYSYQRWYETKYDKQVGILLRIGKNASSSEVWMLEEYLLSCIRQHEYESDKRRGSVYPIPLPAKPEFKLTQCSDDVMAAMNYFY